MHFIVIEKIKKEIWEEAQSTLKEIKKAEHMLFDAIVNFEEYLRQKDGFDYHEWSKGLEDLNIKVGEALENITNKIYDADTFVE